MIKNEFRALGGMSTWEEEMGERERREGPLRCGEGQTLICHGDD